MNASNKTALKAPPNMGSFFFEPLRSRPLLVAAAFMAALTLAGIALLDLPIAMWLHDSGFEGLGLFDKGTALLDLITGKEVSKFLLGGLIVLLGGALAASRRSRRFGFAALYVGAVQLLSTLIAGVSKTVFGRLRPYEVLQGDLPATMWQAGGNSFPSGHTAFYFGLFVPLACLFPKWKWPLLVIPVFIGIARINANEHYLSDVTTSIGLVAVLSWVGLLLVRKRLGLRQSNPAD